MSHLFDLKARLTAMGIVPKMAFGQNFLVSPQVIGKIVQAVAQRDFTDLIEVGPGLGALTEPLVAAHHTPRLIELDRDLDGRAGGQRIDDRVAADLARRRHLRVNVEPAVDETLRQRTRQHGTLDLGGACHLGLLPALPHDVLGHAAKVLRKIQKFGNGLSELVENA